jgi:hypothetical protein
MSATMRDTYRSWGYVASGGKMLSGTEMDGNFYGVLELRGPPASGLRNVGQTWRRRHESPT